MIGAVQESIRSGTKRLCATLGLRRMMGLQTRVEARYRANCTCSYVVALICPGVWVLGDILFSGFQHFRRIHVRRWVLARTAYG